MNNYMNTIVIRLCSLDTHWLCNYLRKVYNKYSLESILSPTLLCNYIEGGRYTYI